MEYLTTNFTAPSDYQPNVVLDLNNSEENKTDVSKASLEELSTIIVSDMISSVKTDLSSLNIKSKRKKKK